MAIEFLTTVFIPSIPSFLRKDLPLTLYSLFIENISFLKKETLALQKYFTFVGMGFSCLGAVYSFFSNNSINQQLFLAFGCIFLISAYHQHVLERSLLQAQTALTEIKKRLTLTEITLSDRERLLNTLSDAIAQLAVSTQFFQTIKDSEGNITLVHEHLASIEKIIKVIQSHFQKSNADTAVKLSEILIFLEKLHKKDINNIALLMEIRGIVVETKEGVKTANDLLKQIQKN